MRHNPVSTAVTTAAALLFGTVLSFARPALAQGTTVDDFQLMSGYSTVATAVATDSHGSVYTVGYGSQPSGRTTPQYWVVRKSVGGTGPFQTVMMYNYPTGSTINSAFAVAVDAADNIYVAGEGASTAKGSVGWLVVKSSDGGATWKVVDYPGVSFGAAYSICTSSTGAIYVLGKGGVAAKGDQWRWMVRKSVNGGATWTTVDSFQLASGYPASGPVAITEDAAGNVYTTGYAQDAANVRHWVVRRGAAYGTSWSTIDDFVHTAGQANYPRSIAVDDATGSVYVTGYAFQTSTTSSAILRRGSTTGNGFVTIGDESGSNAWSLLIGAGGELVQGVSAPASTGGRTWIVRASTDGGTTFSILDQYYVPGTGAWPRALGRSGTSLFAVGDHTYQPGSSLERWLTRKF